MYPEIADEGKNVFFFNWYPIYLFLSYISHPLVLELINVLLHPKVLELINVLQ